MEKEGKAMCFTASGPSPDNTSPPHPTPPQSRMEILKMLSVLIVVSLGLHFLPTRGGFTLLTIQRSQPCLDLVRGVDGQGSIRGIVGISASPMSQHSCPLRILLSPHPTVCPSPFRSFTFQLIK